MDIFATDIVLVPIHYKAPLHWALIAVDMRNRTVTYYDSLLTAGLGDFIIGAMHTFLVEEHLNRRGTKLNFQFRSLWDKAAPQQENGHDCGVYVCQFANHLLQDALFNIKQRDMPMYRQLIVWEIASNSLNTPPSAELNDSLILGIDNIEMQDFNPAD